MEHSEVVEGTVKVTLTEEDFTPQGFEKIQKAINQVAGANEDWYWHLNEVDVVLNIYKVDFSKESIRKNK